MADVFIASAGADAPRAARLGEALGARGFDVGGAAADARAVLALWSAAAVGDAGVLEIAHAALARNALISVRLDATDVPEPFRQMAVEDLSNGTGADGDPGLERIVQALAALRGRPAVAATTRTRDSRLMRRVLFGGGVAALVLLVGFVVAQSMNRPAPLPGPEPDFSLASQEFTDSPGASEMYGLTAEEMRAAAPRDLIELALERTAIETIEAEAARGDALGQALLCLAKNFGEGLPQDRIEARRACERASGGGNALAMYMLSTFARDGEAGYAPNVGTSAEADRLLERAAQGGDPRAQTDLARAALEAGRHEDGRRFAETARNQGYLPAFALVGEIYEQGIGVEQDYARARREYLTASERGDGESSRRLGSLLERGLGGPRDLDQARTYYRRAIAQGATAANADMSRIGPG